MTSSPGSTRVRSATAIAAKPPFVIATSSACHAMPVRAVSVSATVRCEAGSDILYAYQSLSCGSEARWSASTYAGSGISCGLPTAKFAMSGSRFSSANGPVKKERKGATLWRSRSR